MGVLKKLGKRGCFKQTRRNEDALNKLMVGGCPKQTEEKKKSTLNKMTVGGCHKQAERKMMS